MTSLLFSGGLVRPLGGVAEADWVLVSDGAVAGFGDDSDRPSADLEIDLDGGVVVPAFCDAHVHLPATGLYASGLDFRGETSSSVILDALRAEARTTRAALFGGNFEDPLDEPLTRWALDRAVGDRPALVIRADMHSCVTSSALLEQLDLEGVEGVDVDEDGVPTGYLRERAAAGAFSFFETHLPRGEQRAAVRAAIELAYSKGVAAVDEMFVVEWRGWDQLEVLLEVTGEAALDVAVYPATTDVARVVEMGSPHIGGDLFLDGSFGSHTAWMSEPYADAAPPGSPAAGVRYRSDDELLELFSAAQAARLQVGVHAIGDAAIEQAISSWERVAADVGVAAVSRASHRIEHFECSSDDHITRAARLGLRASVQPAFDRFWGGTEGLYARRIGAERALLMNRFGSMSRAGLEIGAGSDSTVTPLDPFLQLAALRDHHVAAESLGGLEALEVHTAGSFGLRRPGVSPRGLMAAGAPADLTWLDRDPVAAEVDDLLATEVLGTWIGGARVWPLEEAERG